MKTIWLFLVGSALITGGSALAGERQENPVDVNVPDMRAGGSFAGAHNSDDTTSYLYCRVFYWPEDTGSVPHAYCAAKDAAGEYGSCLTYDPIMIDIIGSISGDSIVGFGWSTEGTCRYVSVQQASYTPARTH
jgi:hypothetical protein